MRLQPVSYTHLDVYKRQVQTTEGHLGWDVLDKQPSSTLEESARVVVLQKIPQLDGLDVYKRQDFRALPLL